MKAIAIQNGFGIDHLESIEVPKPQPAADEVLVKVQAVALNYVDLMVVTGKMNPNSPAAVCTRGGWGRHRRTGGY